MQRKTTVNLGNLFLLFENYDQVRAYAMGAQAEAKEFYETRFSGSENR